MRKRVILAAALGGAMVFALSACVPDVQGSATTESSEDAKPLQTLVTNDKTLTDAYEMYAEQAEEWAPSVVTLEDGTEVQRVPSSGSDLLYYGADISYNTLYLDAENRGCESCHTDGLADLVDNHLTYMHWKIDNGLGTVKDVNDCIDCHDEIWLLNAPDRGANENTGMAFGQLIHGIHNRDGFKGDCMSCHAATEDGNGLQLWDDVKYDIMTGINSVENVQGEFSYDQDHVQGDNLVLTWWPTEDDFTNGVSGPSNDSWPGDDSYKTWEINISGDVENPYTITLQELIDQAPSETFVSKLHCVENWATGELIANVEVTGIPLTWLAEKAGVKEGVNSITMAAADGKNMNPYENLFTEGGWLIYKVNGRDLYKLEGYPVRAWFPDHGAPPSRRWLTDIIFEQVPQEEVDNIYFYDTEKITEGQCKPSVAVCNIHEGQVIKAGETFTFEGYADAQNSQVAAIEFSMDGGKTWTRFDTSQSDKSKWVWWNFDFTPEEPGAYVLLARGITDAGNVSPIPDRVMVNAK